MRKYSDERVAFRPVADFLSWQSMPEDKGAGAVIYWEGIVAIDLNFKWSGILLNSEA